MNSLFALAAPLALLLPMAGGAAAPAERKAPPVAASAPQCDAAAAQAMPRLPSPLSAFRNGSVARQIRIERRVVVRIAPQSPAARQALVAEAFARNPSMRYKEGAKEKCVPLAAIGGVQTGSGNRLVLYLRDSRMMSVNLEKACRARDFYSGFYVEKSRDGRLCIDRDKLQSRTGARCEVEAMRQLVVVRD